ncbi:MAG: peptidoglycan D,D-transpeptidase FtsI family protein [Roseburia sp.]
MTKKMAKQAKRKQKPQDSTPKWKTSHKNREFAVVTYAFLAIFVGLMGYFVYYQFFKSEDFINSPYNSRQDTFSTRIVRGDIVSADGKVLAETVTDAEGNETRNYPYGNMFAHAVGYSVNGKAGIESQMNFNLLRSHTFFLEQIVNELQGEKNQGDTVVTTLDYTLQSTAYHALGSYDGAVVVLEPSTGKILAMVSKPDYDPNTIAAEWDSLISSDSSVLLNRTTQGLYPPGSTFKIFTTLEYAHEHSDLDEYIYECSGSFTSDGATIHCYNNKSHGTESLMDSFSHSCNSSYASIGLTLDIEDFNSLCNSLLFNTNLPTTYESSVSSFSLAKDAGDSMIMETAIGQGETLVTPMHMALITSAIANDGVLMRPYVVDHTENEKGVVVKEYSPSVYGTLLSSEDAALLQEYMEAVVSEGTGTKLSGQSYTAAGKTGSAEFTSAEGDGTHSWFVGYASWEGKEDIAVAVIVEDSGAGSEYAVPVAKQIFDAYGTLN